MGIKAILTAMCPGPLKPVMDRIEASPIGFRLAQGAFWSMAGAVVSRSLMLFASILIARILGKTGFGELGIIQSTVGMFGVFAGFGLGLTATKHVAEFRTKDPARAGHVIALSGLVALITGGAMAVTLATFSTWLAVHTLAAPQLTGLLRIGAIMLFLEAINGAQIGALSGFEAFRHIAIVNLWGGLAAFPLMVAGAYTAGLQGAVWGLVGSRAISWLLNHLALRQAAARYSVPLSFACCWQERSVLWSFSLPAALSGIMVTPVSWACNALLVNQPNGYGEMGILNAANQWRNLLLFLPSLLSSVLLPVLSHSSSQSHGFARAFEIAHRLTLVLVLPVSLLLMLAAPWLIAMYGRDFHTGRTAMVYSVAAAAVFAIGSQAGTAITARSRMWLGFLINTSHAGLYLLLSLCLVARLGAAGIALSLLIAYVCLTLWGYCYLYPQLPPRVFQRTIMATVVITLAAVAVSAF
ncbi:MAG: oligosaccharide flippase family protein [Phycisphaerae bacterium]|nr:oligosaccharide flippase family protein [Phycisphaerae bacterium]